jgi:ribose transport system permease protein
VSVHSPIAAAAQAGPSRAIVRRPRLQRRLRLAAPLIVLVVLCLLIGVANPNFLSTGNFVRVATAASIPLVLTLGATFIILLGSIDLSIEGVLAVASIVLALLVANDAGGGADLGLVAVLFAVATGTAMGLLNGVLHVGLKIPSFMVTIGSWFIGLGAATILLGGSTVRITDPTIRALALTRLAGMPLSVWIALGALFVAWVIQNHTRFGRHVYAIGGGEDLAALSGVPIRRTKIIAFALAGSFYGLASVLATAQLGQANAEIGTGRLFTTVTAVVVGGTSLMGGQGGVLNALVGILIVSVLANGMVLLGIPPYLQQAAQGLMIIAAVALSLDRSQLRIVK